MKKVSEFLNPGGPYFSKYSILESTHRNDKDVVISGQEIDESCFSIPAISQTVNWRLIAYVPLVQLMLSDTRSRQLSFHWYLSGLLCRMSSYKSVARFCAVFKSTGDSLLAARLRLIIAPLSPDSAAMLDQT